MTVARTRLGNTMRVLGHIESGLAVDGADARDIALMFIGRFDELADGDQLTVRKEWK